MTKESQRTKKNGLAFDAEYFPGPLPTLEKTHALCIDVSQILVDLVGEIEGHCELQAHDLDRDYKWRDVRHSACVLRDALSALLTELCCCASDDVFEKHFCTLWDAYSSSSQLVSVETTDKSGVFSAIEHFSPLVTVLSREIALLQEGLSLAILSRVQREAKKSGNSAIPQKPADPIRAKENRLNQELTACIIGLDATQIRWLCYAFSNNKVEQGRLRAAKNQKADKPRKRFAHAMMVAEELRRKGLVSHFLSVQSRN